MYCVSPVTIRIKNRDLSGEFHLVNNHFVESRTRKVRCHSCLGCRINDTLQTTVRLVLEKKQYPNSMCCFLTLTYDDEHMPENRTLVRKDLQDFNKRIRSRLDYESKINKTPKKVVRYYAVGEYGDDTSRPHYHIAYFGLGNTPENRRMFYEEWQKCSPYMIINNPKAVKPLDNHNIEYIAGYVQKKLKGPKAEEEYTNTNRISPFSFSSQRLGLSSFLEKKDIYERDGFIYYNSMEVPIPRYYVDKLDLTLPKSTFEKSPYREVLKKYKLIDDEYDKRLLSDSYINQTDLYQTIIPSQMRDTMKKTLETKNNLFKRGTL